MLRRVAFARTDVSEELIAFIIRVTTLAVTRNRSTLHPIHSPLGHWTRGKTTTYTEQRKLNKIAQIFISNTNRTHVHRVRMGGNSRWLRSRVHSGRLAQTVHSVTIGGSRHYGPYRLTDEDPIQRSSFRNSIQKIKYSCGVLVKGRILSFFLLLFHYLHRVFTNHSAGATKCSHFYIITPTSFAYADSCEEISQKQQREGGEGGKRCE
jgi:hypothetical protein